MERNLKKNYGIVNSNFILLADPNDKETSEFMYEELERLLVLNCEIQSYLYQEEDE